MTFREQALEFFRGQLGEPDQIGHESARVYRWTVRRPGRPALHVYLNIGSHANGDTAHVLIGDPCAPEDARIESFSIKSGEDFDQTLERLRAHE